MKRDRITLFGTLFVLALLSGACYFPQATSTEDKVAAEVEKALQEALQETAAAQAAATYTPYPTYTPQPTYTSEPFPNQPYYEPYHPSDSGGWMGRYCDKAEFRGENYADYTVFDNREDFTKTWVLKNIGYCTWTTDYNLVFTSGNSMSGDISSPLPYDVPPGGIVEVSVDLEAPSKDGTYKGEWAIENESGYNFANFWVLIKVR